MEEAKTQIRRGSLYASWRKTGGSLRMEAQLASRGPKWKNGSRRYAKCFENSSEYPPILSHLWRGQDTKPSSRFVVDLLSILREFSTTDKTKILRSSIPLVLIQMGTFFVEKSVSLVEFSPFRANEFTK